MELENVRDRYTNLCDFSLVNYFILSLEDVVEQINITDTTMLERKKNELLINPLLV
jgi:hypothetical protein